MRYLARGAPMTKMIITDKEKEVISQYLSENHLPDLVNTYLCFIGKKLNIQPVLYVKDKVIYQNAEEVVERLSQQGKLWRETEIKVGYHPQNVNEETKRIYICPFSGKVFADNTHPNPQDAIYEWVASCPENTELMGGLKAKRFFVSEDPGVIKGYMEKEGPAREATTKVVYSSVASGKLFANKEAVIEDFRQQFLKKMQLVEVPNQNRFKIDEKLLQFLQDQLVEEKINEFVEALSEIPEFSSHIEQWVGGEE